MSNAIAIDTPPDLAPIKARQQQTWGSGNYAHIGAMLQIVGETLAEAVDLRSGEQVLDVAAGNGNFSLAAARRLADVTSTDYVPALLERGAARAAADGLEVTFQPADAEALPFDDARFDVVGSTFGVMFTPDQGRAAAEMARVCRPGGRIGLANWTPDGFIGQLFKTVGAHVPPPTGVPSPALWGTPEHLEVLFAASAARIDIEERSYVFRDLSPQAFVDRFREVYGPVRNAFAALDAADQARLEQDLLALIVRFDRAGDGTLRIPGAYLEVVVTRR